MILVGAQPPGGMVWDPEQADELIRVFGRLWADQPEQVRRHPDLVEAVQTVNADMPKRWLFMPIHPGNVRASAHAMIFNRETAAKVFDAYVAAANGDASGLWLISVVAPYIFPEVVNWGENASKAMSADYQPGRDYYSELDPPGAIFGAPLGSFLWSPVEKWPVEPMDDIYRRADTSEVPTLLVSGNLDLSTPAENVANGLLPYLPNGLQVVLREQGHVGDLWGEDPEGMYRLTSSFLETGVADTTHLEYVPMDFSVSWGFPTLAKLIVAGVAFGVLLLVVLIWFLIKRRRKRSI
jgi:pimeloyl-ACP methyl ester carboxylesterase